MSTQESQLVLGIDIGGTRTKVGIVDETQPGLVLAREVFPTERTDEKTFLEKLKASAARLAEKAGTPLAAGVSIGSYVFADGSIDGLSSMIAFMTHGYPLGQRVSEVLGLTTRVDNDARLIGLAETVTGAGRGFSRVLTLTLGTGIGVGLTQDGCLVGDDSFMHLAGHIRVREGGEYPWLDAEPCYCGDSGCFEATCSGTALNCHIAHVLSGSSDAKSCFEAAASGDRRASSIVDWYLTYLLRALNQYVYLYCPDVIVLGGGVAHGLAPLSERISQGITASVYEGQHTQVRVTELSEDSGIIGAASLFAVQTPKPDSDAGKVATASAK